MYARPIPLAQHCSSSAPAAHRTCYIIIIIIMISVAVYIIIIIVAAAAAAVSGHFF
jgi:hypothetical protein